jgi:hypothetical protein
LGIFAWILAVVDFCFLVVSAIIAHLASESALMFENDNIRREFIVIDTCTRARRL